MSNLSGESVTKQEAKLKEKDEQIKEMEKIIRQQKVQMYIDNSGQWVYMINIIDVFTGERLSVITKI